jgi:serine/threonine protein kinase
MDLADGSLRARLQECLRQGQPGVPAAELLGYLGEAAAALDYLHGQRLLHRDVKPENLLLVRGRAQVTDAGLARLQGAPRLSTSSGAGTPLYMAPEVFRGRAGPAGDQYSLALTYAELRLGRRVLRGVTLMELMREHRDGTPDLAPLPEAEQQVLRQALAKEPGQRYPSCAAFAAAAAEAAGAGRAQGRNEA